MTVHTASIFPQVPVQSLHLFSGIVAVVAGLLLIVLIFLLILRYRRRKRRRDNERFENNRGSNHFIYNCDDIKRNNKMNNVDASNVQVRTIVFKTFPDELYF